MKRTIILAVLAIILMGISIVGAVDTGDITIKFTLRQPQVFDTGEGTYPSISGTHKGTIIPLSDIEVDTIYIYSCPGTGGHIKYVKLWNETWNTGSTERYWKSYRSVRHNISFEKTFVLQSGEEYNYTITTGSYPQIIHKKKKMVEGGIITCSKFTDTNGKTYKDWIPSIRLFKK